MRAKPIVCIQPSLWSSERNGGRSHDVGRRLSLRKGQVWSKQAGYIVRGYPVGGYIVIVMRGIAYRGAKG